MPGALRLDISERCELATSSGQLDRRKLRKCKFGKHLSIARLEECPRGTRLALAGMDAPSPTHQARQMLRIMSVSRFAVATYVAYAVVLLAAALACTMPVQGNGSEEDGAVDGWRRTASGWELVSRWREEPRVRYSADSAIRLDGHPAALALLQSLAVVGAFALFPPSRFTRSGAAA
jgi:hypothetical protein